MAGIPGQGGVQDCVQKGRLAGRRNDQTRVPYNEPPVNVLAGQWARELGTGIISEDPGYQAGAGRPEKNQGSAVPGRERVCCLSPLCFLPGVG